MIHKPITCHCSKITSVKVLPQRSKTASEFVAGVWESPVAIWPYSYRATSPEPADKWPMRAERFWRQQPVDPPEYYLFQWWLNNQRWNQLRYIEAPRWYGGEIAWLYCGFSLWFQEQMNRKPNIIQYSSNLGHIWDHYPASTIHQELRRILNSREGIHRSISSYNHQPY